MKEFHIMFDDEEVEILCKFTQSKLSNTNNSYLNDTEGAVQFAIGYLFAGFRLGDEVITKRHYESFTKGVVFSYDKVKNGE